MQGKPYTISLPVQLFSEYNDRIKELITLARIKYHFNNGDLGRKLNFKFIAKTIGMKRTTVRPHLQWLMEVGLIGVHDGKIKHVCILKHFRECGIKWKTDIVKQFTATELTTKSNRELAKVLKAELISHAVHSRSIAKQLRMKQQNWHNTKTKGTKKKPSMDIEFMDDLGLSKCTDGTYLGNAEAGRLLKSSKSSGYRFKKLARDLGLIKINKKRDYVTKAGHIKHDFEYYMNPPVLSQHDEELLDKYYNDRRFTLVHLNSVDMIVWTDMCFPVIHSFDNITAYRSGVKLSVKLMMKLKLDYRSNKINRVISGNSVAA